MDLKVKELISDIRTSAMDQPIMFQHEGFDILTQDELPLLVENHLKIKTEYQEENKRYFFSIFYKNIHWVDLQTSADICHKRGLNYVADLVGDLHLEVWLLPPPLKEKPKYEYVTRAEMFDEIQWETEASERDQEEKVLIKEEVKKDSVIFSFPKLHEEGYMILRGKPRFIPPNERLIYNVPFLFIQKHASSGEYLKCEIRSEHLGISGKYRATSTLSVCIPTPENQKFVGGTRQLFVEIPFLKPLVPLSVVMSALGCPYEMFEKLIFIMDRSRGGGGGDDDPKTLFRSYLLKYKNSNPCQLPRKIRSKLLKEGKMDQVIEREKRAAILEIARLHKKISNPNEEKTIKSTEQTIISSIILPHLNDADVPDVSDNMLKVYYFCWIAGILIRFSENQGEEETDRDAYPYIVLSEIRELLGILMRQLLIQDVKQLTKSIRRMLTPTTTRRGRGGGQLQQQQQQQQQIPPPPLVKIQKPPPDRVCIEKLSSRLLAEILCRLATGIFSEKKTGMTQQFRTTNPAVITAQHRRISRNYSGKQHGPLQAHDTAYGYIAPEDSPDGENCGKVLALAWTAMITMGSESEPIMELLINYVLKDYFHPLVEEPSSHSVWYLLIDPNGIPRGWLENAHKCCHIIRTMRRKGEIDPYISVWWDDNRKTVNLLASSGRLVRPLIVFENVHKAADIITQVKTSSSHTSILHALVKHGVVEYLDPSESCSTNTIISLRLDEVLSTSSSPLSKITHIEVSRDSFLGLLAAGLPFPQCNQGPRTSYMVGMDKQCISLEMAEDKDYGSKKKLYLQYAQYPLVHTEHEKERMDGIQVSVALFSHPYNQEDGLLFNSRFLQFGGFRMTQVQTFTSMKTPRPPNGFQDIFEKPDPEKTSGIKHSDYSKLDADGLPTPGTMMGPGDVVIGKTIPKTVYSSKTSKVPSTFSSEVDRIDASTVLRKESGRVHDVQLGTDSRKVFLRMDIDSRRGDKFTNRHGQKGTIGLILPPEDFPFDPLTGIIPDVLIGPPSLPSRMTMGKLLEILIGKVIGITGDLSLGIDDHFFDEKVTEENLQKMSKILVKHGFRADGKTRMRCGLTGELIEAPIFTGLIYMSRLTHLVQFKAHARRTGPVDSLTWQPVAGRSMDGGFKFGHMEFDCLTSYGGDEALSLLPIRGSDRVSVYICNQCGNYADGNPNIQYFMCRVCKTGKHVYTVEQSKSFVVMCSEMKATGIDMKFKVVEKK